jgi:glycine cleavage system H protein
MSLALLLLFIVLVLVADAYLSRRRAATAPSVINPRAVPRRRADNPLDDLLFHPGHAWVRFERDDLVSVGASDFAAHFAGDIVSLELPVVGTTVGEGELAWSFVSARDRRLALAMPLTGDIVAVNHELERDVGVVQRSPYEDGWILKVRPTRVSASLRKLFRGGAAKAWMQSTRDLVSAKLVPELGVVAQDGGVWNAGFGDQLDFHVWERLRRDLFPGLEEPDGGEEGRDVV